MDAYVFNTLSTKMFKKNNIYFELHYINCEYTIKFQFSFIGAIIFGLLNVLNPCELKLRRLSRALRCFVSIVTNTLLNPHRDVARNGYVLYPFFD